MAQIILGLDIARNIVRVAKLASSYKEVALLGFYEQKIEQGGEKPFGERLAVALAALKEQGALSAELIYTALPPEDVAVHRITLPFTDRKKMEQTLPFELEEKIPKGIEDVIYDYTVISQSKEITSLLVSVIERAKLSELMKAFAAVGIDPPLITVDIYAYQALLKTIEAMRAKAGGEASTSQPSVAEPPFAIMDIGEKLSVISVIGDGKVRFGRVIRWGVENLKQSAENKATVALLLNHVKLSLQADYKDNFAPVETLYITGCAVEYEGFEELFKSKFNLRVETLATFAAPSGEAGGEIVSPPRNGYERALALALLARAAKRGIANFRKGEFAYRGDFQLIRGGLIRAAIGFVLILVLASINSYLSYSSLKAHEEELDGKLCEITKQVFGRCYDSYTQALAALNAPRGKSTGLGSIPAVTALDILSEISRRKPKDIGLYVVNNVEIDMQKMRMDGEVDSYNSLDMVVNELKQYEGFKEVNLTRSAKSLDGKKIEFDITVKLGL
ncbi:MAG: hypothetical protein Kow0090_04160 [Myxococcota bacterium]